MASPMDDRDEDDEDDRPRPKRRRPDDDDLGDYDDGPRGVRPQPKGLALTAMICGIASLPFSCLCGCFAAPAALCGIIFGFIGLKQSKGMATTGIILGFLSIAIEIALFVYNLDGIQKNGGFKQFGR